MVKLEALFVSYIYICAGLSVSMYAKETASLLTLAPWTVLLQTRLFLFIAVLSKDTIYLGFCLRRG
jgi:hypothetical protein